MHHRIHFAIIVAAGSGTRMGGTVPKQFMLLDHRSVLGATLDRLLAADALAGLVVVVPDADMDRGRDVVAAHVKGNIPATVVAGGASRQDSVRCGLAALDHAAPEDLIWVHDGARPFPPLTAIRDCMAAAEKDGAAILAMGAQDTLKIVDDADRIVRTLDRRRIVLAQTPQIFRHDLLRRAYDAAIAHPQPATDDAELVQRLGVAVTVVAGSPTNIKMTTPADLALARALLKDSS